MLASVNVEIKETAASGTSSAGTGVHVKVGVAGNGVQPGSTVRILSTMGADKIRMLLGDSPLADACMDSAENGAREIYCIPAEGSVKSSIGAMEKPDGASGSLSVTGEPCGSYDLMVRITEAGTLNTARYEYSLDGGNCLSEEFAVPADGNAEIADTGLKLKFTGDYAAGEEYRVKVTGPSMSNQDVLAVVRNLRNFDKDIEFVHIVGVTAEPLWKALEQTAMEIEQEAGKPLLFLVEQRPAGSDETAAAYVDAIRGEAGKIGRHVVVSQSWIHYARKNGRTVLTNAAGVVAGLIASAKESTSVAFVRDFPIPAAKVLGLYPENIGDYLEVLEENRYLVLRRYTGREDYYVAADNTAVKEDSPFSCITNARVMYRVVREVYKRAQMLQNMEYDRAQPDVALAGVRSDLNIAVDAAKAEGIISEGEVTLVQEDDETLQANVSLRPKGYYRTFNLTFGLVI